jgi:hypothetical protein
MSTTTKAEAFAAPKWAFDTDAFDDGDNTLSKEEILLAESYESLGRHDLAECVRGGKVFQRLHRIILGWQPSDRGDKKILAAVNGLTDAFLGASAGPLPETLDDWIGMALEAQKDDPDLPTVIDLDAKIMREEFAMAQKLEVAEQEAEEAGSEGSGSGSGEDTVIVSPVHSLQELFDDDEERGEKDEASENDEDQEQDLVAPYLSFRNRLYM